MKKKLIALVTALTLCAAVVIGTTLAFYSAQTAEVQNTFTYSPGKDDPEPKIDEPHFPKDPTVTPGVAVQKDPYIYFNNSEAVDDNGYFVAFIIRGSSPLAGKSLLSAILADGTGKVGTKKVPVFNADGSRKVDPVTGQFEETDEDVIEDVGLAKIYGWSDKYTYDVNSKTGDVYAYYKEAITKASAKITVKIGGTDTQVFGTVEPVFKAVITNTKMDTMFATLKTQGAGKDIHAYDIYVQGYVVSALNDTKTNATGGYDKWADAKAAMAAAFPTVFVDKTAVTGQYPYKYPTSAPKYPTLIGQTDPFQPVNPLG